MRGCRWITFTTSDGLADNWVTSIAIDADGLKWIGTRGGMSVLDDKGDGDFTKRHATADGFTSYGVNGSVIDGTGSVRVGTGGGLSALPSGVPLPVSFPVGRHPTDIAHDGTHVWVTNHYGDTDDSVSKLRVDATETVGVLPRIS
jgi:hypothetical protein